MHFQRHIKSNFIENTIFIWCKYVLQSFQWINYALINAPNRRFFSIESFHFIRWILAIKWVMRLFWADIMPNTISILKRVKYRWYYIADVLYVRFSRAWQLIDFPSNINECIFSFHSSVLFSFDRKWKYFHFFVSASYTQIL